MHSFSHYLSGSVRNSDVKDPSLNVSFGGIFYETIFSYPSDWEEWGDWSECSQSCGSGFQSRMRTCNPGEDGQACTGPTMIRRVCNTTPCYCELTTILN